jgi:ATP-dependent protease HslVU (ClpYQ) peptidase subunit
MGIFASASNAIVATFDTVTRIATAADETVGIGTTYVENRAKKQRKTDKENVILATAKEMQAVKSELKKDKELESLFNKLAKDW